MQVDNATKSVVASANTVTQTSKLNQQVESKTEQDSLQKNSKLKNNNNKYMKDDVFQKLKENPEYIPSVAEQTVISTIENANKKLMGLQAEFEFSVHKQTKQIMVKVINKETKEVVREIPPEKTLDMVARMWELAGILVDERR